MGCAQPRGSLRGHLPHASDRRGCGHLVARVFSAAGPAVSCCLEVEWRPSCRPGRLEMCPSLADGGQRKLQTVLNDVQGDVPSRNLKKDCNDSRRIEKNKYILFDVFSVFSIKGED